MGKSDIYEMISAVKERRSRDQKGFNYARQFIMQMEDDIIIAKKRDEKFLSEVKNLDPEIEELYEERRRNQIVFLERKDAAAAQLEKDEKAKMEEYDRELAELNEKLKSYDDNENDDNDDKKENADDSEDE